MTEKEKMLKGENYFAGDKTLTRDREDAKELVFDYNNLRPKETEKKTELLKKLLGKTKEFFTIEPNFFCDYGYNIEIGENFYSNHNLIILDCAKVKIGDNVMFGPNVSIYTAGHPLEIIERNKGSEFAKPVTIGNNVWIGGNVVILPNLTIGDGVVIGAGSVITKNIPANSLVIGNPGKVIRNLN